jgi:acetate kinase
MSKRYFLAVNAGSSSLKCAVFAESGGDIDEHPLWSAHVSWTSAQSGDTSGTLCLMLGSGQKLKEPFSSSDRRDFLRRVLADPLRGPTAAIPAAQKLTGIGHRMVHGGKDLRRPIRLNADVEKKIEALQEFAPLHIPANLETYRIAGEIFPGDIPHIAVFDTAFHADLPPAAAAYGLPLRFFEEGLYRYGFHGINHQYAAGRAAVLLQRPLSELNVITCHLGSGCSICAVQGGRSVDTTMGFSPLEGLMMGTRSGSVDPGLLFYLQRTRGMSLTELEHLLNAESGLLGVSGLSADMSRIVQEKGRGDAEAELAFDMFVRNALRGIGAMAAALPGLDALVFTGGIGENSTEVRAAICAGLSLFGVQRESAEGIDEATDALLSPSAATPAVLLIHAKEELEIARECAHMLTA